MEEFERLELELQQLYQDYLLRFRCLAYLEQQQDEAEQTEQERMQAREVTEPFLEQGIRTCDGPEIITLWPSGQSTWLQIQRFWVLYLALPDFLRISGSGTGSTQPCECN
jgi:hypothetical protein